MNRRIRIVIADDEHPAREELKFLLNECSNSQIEIVATAKDGCDALEKISNTDPDCVFLDIEMPHINGMELAGILSKNKPEVSIVFVTAFNEHAVKAFELNAIDYVLKPFSKERLEKTISKIFERKTGGLSTGGKIEELLKQIYKMNSSLDTSSGSSIKKLPCNDRGRMILVSRDDIRFCSVEDGKTLVATKDEVYRTCHTLTEIEEKFNLFRAHRSHVVNLEHITLVEPMFHGSYCVVLNNDNKTSIPVSRNKSKELKSIFGL